MKILSYWVSKYIKTQYDQSITKKWSLAPNGPEKWGCRIRDLFSKIRDLFNKFKTYAVIRDYETKKTAGADEPPSLAPMKMILTYVHKDLFLLSTYKWSYPWCASSKMSYFRGKYYIQIFKKNLLGYKSCKQ